MAGRGLVLTGARARFSIDGVKVMYSTSVDYSEDIEQTPIEVLDQLEVAEHVATAYRVSLSAQHVRVITNPIKNRDGIRIFPRLEDIISHPEMTAVIEDRITGTVLATVQRVKPARYRSAIGARGIVLVDTEFVAIRIQDESEVL
jgi:hypothetical protein